MAIDWGLAKTPVGSIAPVSPLSNLANVVPAFQQAQGNAATIKTNQAMANVAPEMAKAGLSAAQMQNASKAYEMAQQILGPSMMALNNGDESAAADIYEKGVQALKSAGIDTASVGAPDKFDPTFVKSAFSNVSQQMAMMKQMMDMQSQQSMIDYHSSQVNKNAADVGKINYETGANYPTGGAFTFPGQGGQVGGGMQSGGISGLTPKGQAEVNQAQATKAIEARATLASNADAARGTLNLANEAESIMKAHPLSSGKAGLITQFTSPAQERLGSIFDQFTVNKLKTDYAGAGLGALDVAVFNVLKNTKSPTCN